MTPQFVDISAFQGAVDWALYKQWAAQWDGVSRIAMKATEGVGFTDPSFEAHRSGALSAGIDQIWYYHFARPNLGNSAQSEAAWFRSVVGAIRETDMVFLDIEVGAAQNIADFAAVFLAELQSSYGKAVGLYSYLSFIQANLQRSELAAYPLWLAEYTYDPSARPACPAPWQSYVALQYTDRASNVPGMPGDVDANVFLGGNNIMGGIPQGWSDDGQTLTAPNDHKVVLGFRDHILNNQWDPGNVPLEEEHGASPVEDYYSQTPPDGTRQMFLYSELGYTVARGVYQIGVGNELSGCRADRDQAKTALTTAQAQIATLQSQIDANPVVMKAKALFSAADDLKAAVSG